MRKLITLTALSLILAAGCKDSDLSAPDQIDAVAKEVISTPVVTLAVDPEWQASLESLVKSADLVGAAALVMKDDEFVAAASTGEKQLGKTDPISPDEVWHIGSITKSMTATMIARLVEQDILSWDTTVKDAFGEEEIDPSWHDVTIKQLLTHTGGARANFSSMSQTIWPENAATLSKVRREWTRGIMSVPTVYTPGEDFIYSNVGYTIAGVMAEKLSGQNWEDLIRYEIFYPLGLSSGGFGAPYSITEKPAAWGHSGPSGRKKSHDPTDRSDNTPIMGPAGIVHMTLEDLARYGLAHVKGMNGQSDYLNVETFDILHTPVMENYAMGWGKLGERPWAEGNVTYHNGSNTMWYALVVLVPDQNIVYALASNDGNAVNAETDFIKAIANYNRSILETE